MESKLDYIVLILGLLYLTWHVWAAVDCSEKLGGRHSDEEDNTCKNYTLCVYDRATDKYKSYNYVCPGSSMFNPKLSLCTANYTCYRKVIVVD